jgi:hypothetical protein
VPTGMKNSGSVISDKCVEICIWYEDIIHEMDVSW